MSAVVGSPSALGLSSMDDNNNNDNMNVDESMLVLHNNPNAQSSSLALPPPLSEFRIQEIIQNPVEQWPLISPEWYRTSCKSLILRVIREATTLPPKSQFERCFIQSLRFDKDVVLAFCHRDDFVDIYYTRHLYIPGTLYNDKDVMLAYCQKIPRSLQECNCDTIMNDMDVVTAAVSLSGMELQYASRTLQENEALLRLACSNDGRALDCCPPGIVRTKLLNDVDFIKTVISNNGYHVIWKHLPIELQQDRSLVLLALTQVSGSGGMPFHHVPVVFQQDTNFIVDAVSRRADLFMKLPLNLQTNVRIAHATIVSTTSTETIIQHVVNAISIPTLLDHTTTTLNNDALAAVIVDRGPVSLVQELILTHRPMLLHDRSCMLRAIQRAPDLYDSLPQTSHLRQDVDLVHYALTPDNVVTLLSQQQTLFWIALHVDAILVHAVKICKPHLLVPLYRATCTASTTNPHAVRPRAILAVGGGGGAAQAAGAVNNNNNNNIIQRLRAVPPLAAPPQHPSVWETHRPLQMAWIQRGCVSCYRTLQHIVHNDRELALLIAQHYVSDFVFVSDTLRSDRAFVQEAVQRSGHVMNYLPPSTPLRQDLRLWTFAVATSNVHILPPSSTTGSSGTTASRTTATTAAAAAGAGALFGGLRLPVPPPALPLRQLPTRNDVLQHVRQQLDLYNVFVTDFLRGCNSNSSSNRGNPCYLPMLDCGMETGTALKRHIASFLGVPVGRELLHVYRKALEYLTATAPPAPAVASQPSAAQALAQQQAQVHRRPHLFMAAADPFDDLDDDDAWMLFNDFVDDDDDDDDFMMGHFGAPRRQGMMGGRRPPRGAALLQPQPWDRLVAPAARNGQQAAPPRQQPNNNDNDDDEDVDLPHLDRGAWPGWMGLVAAQPRPPPRPIPIDDQDPNNNILTTMTMMI